MAGAVRLEQMDEPNFNPIKRADTGIENRTRQIVLLLSSQRI